MSKGKSKSHLKPRNEKSFERRTNCREERVSSKDINKITFSLKDYTPNQPKGNEQSFSSWEENKILSDLLDSLHHLSELTIVEAKQQGLIKEYSKLPDKSKFKTPTKIKEDARWSSINKITGQKARVIGHIIDNVFYIVF